jgi:hypothetical protein
MESRSSRPPQLQGLPEEFAGVLRRLRDADDPRLNLVLAGARKAGWHTPTLAATVDLGAAAVSKRVERARRALRNADPVATALMREIDRDISIPDPPKRRVTLDGKQLPEPDIARLKQWQLTASRVNGAMPAGHPDRRISEKLSRELQRLIDEEGFTAYYLARVLGLSHRAVTSRLERHHFREPCPSVAGTPSGEYRNRKIGDPTPEKLHGPPAESLLVQLRTIRCWHCGVQPEDLDEVRSPEGSVRFVPQWPVGDHEHAERPPTPEGLHDAGSATFLRILQP